MALILVVVYVSGRWLVSRFLTGGPIIPADHCVAQASGYEGSMLPAQGPNAAIIVGEAIIRGLPARAATIALAAAWQESALLNLDYGDRDSLGLFQQRPSQGWGTPEQIMDPWYAAGKFYDALVKIKGWQTGDVNDMAQKVQISAFPDAYRQHESAARAWASTLTGNTSAGVRCVINNGSGGGAADLKTLLDKIWGDKLTIDQTDSTIKIKAPDSDTAWSVAQISMIQLAQNGFVSVQVAGWSWQMDPHAVATWSQVDASTALGANQVVLVLA